MLKPLGEALSEVSAARWRQSENERPMMALPPFTGKPACRLANIIEGESKQAALSRRFQGNGCSHHDYAFE
jgi:hypothetical protein